jgi:cytochrome P450
MQPVMLEQRFVPPRPTVAGPPPQGLPLMRALRTNVLKLWPDEAYERDALVHSFLGRRVVLLNAPDAIHRVLVENEDNYRRSPIRIRLLRPVVGGGLLLSEGQVWRHQRRTAAPAFTPRGIPILSHHVAEAVQEGLAVLASRAEPLVDVFETVQRWAAEVAGRSMFSLEMRTYGPEMRKLARAYVRDHARPSLLDALLPLRIPSPNDVARKRFSRRWMSLIERMIATRVSVPDADAPRDLLDMLREARDPEGGQGFSALQLRDQVATMLVAGHETTSIAAFWSLFLLASVPSAQERLAEETRDLDLSPAGVAAALPKLVYTRAVVSEALRLYPPAFWIVREAIGRDRCGTVDVPRGAMVLVSPWVLGRHARYWDDPHAFDPSRFLPGAPAAARFAYLPFGTGPRICIGAQIAMPMAMLMVAGLVQRFRLSVESAEPVLPVCVITTRPDHAAQFKLTPR